jgi:hypothetical protein
VEPSSNVPEKSPPIFFAGGDVPRRRGRPRVEEPRSSVSTWVPASYHDRLIKMAEQKDVSVSMLVRSLLMIQLKRNP